MSTQILEDVSAKLRFVATFPPRRIKAQEGRARLDLISHLKVENVVTGRTHATFVARQDL